MDFIELNQKYEAWLRTQLPVIEIDLELKHQRMRDNPFSFLRASFFRWSDLWQKHMQAFHSAPKILAIGDLHIENFGTWRDLEGRLIWGVNDFDEACEMPYAIDLIRLATSACLASSCEHLKLSCKQITQSILKGYQEGLVMGGKAFILEEEHAFLREVALNAIRDPKIFFEKIASRFPTDIKPSSEVKSLLVKHLPKGSKNLSFAHRPAGLGSLGRPRFIVCADFGGGLIVREAKALVPSAFLWSIQKMAKKLYCQKTLNQAIRVPDPMLYLSNKWVIKRLAPHCSKIEFKEILKKYDGIKLLHAMGFELANVHMSGRKSILKDMKNRRPADWIRAVELMCRETLKDWQDWVKFTKN